MNKRVFISFLATLALAIAATTKAQPRKPYRVGVIHLGGPYTLTVDGFKDGLREAGLEPGKDVLLEIRDLHGNEHAIGNAARSLEQAKVDLLLCLATGVAVASKAATREVPIVFAIGTDATANGLAASLAKPGGRLTGVQRLTTDLTGKRLEILKEMLPNLHKVAAFYDPANKVAIQAMRLAREAASKLKIEIKERFVTSVDELRVSLNALDPKEIDAVIYVSDVMVTSQSKLIIDAARAKKLPTMLAEPDLVALGALAAYGVSFYYEGRLSAKYVQHILAGTNPKDLPIESISRYELGINLQTARELSITIPQSVLFRADRVIE